MDPIAGLGSEFLPSHPPPQQENSFSQTPQIFLLLFPPPSPCPPGISLISLFLLHQIIPTE